jgi:hypothetical protein
MGMGVTMGRGRSGDHSFFSLMMMTCHPGPLVPELLPTLMNHDVKHIQMTNFYLQSVCNFRFRIDWLLA